MKKRNLASLLLGAVLICSLCMNGCGNHKTVSQSVLESAGATESPGTSFGNLNQFTADTLDQGTFTQENLSEKDVTVINFWSTLCGPCVKELPDIAAFAKTLPDNVQVLTACFDGEGAQEEVKAILKKAGFEGITLLGGEGDYKKLSTAVQYTPTTVFLDKDGNMAGSALIGGQENLAQSYGDAVNSILKSQGRVSVQLLLAELGIIFKTKGKQRNSLLPNHTVFLYDVN